MKKIIIITGCSAAGKTYALRTIFGIPTDARFGIKGAIKKGLPTKGSYTYFPEFSGIKGIEDKLKEEVEKADFIIHDLQWMFRSKSFKFFKREDCEIIHLKPSKEDLWEQMNNRASDSFGKRTKKEVYDTNLKLQNAIDRLEGFKCMTQLELIDYLNGRINA